MSKLAKEIWRGIDNFEYYQVSNWGRVRSINRRILHKNGTVQFLKGRVLKPGRHKKGKGCEYFFVNLRHDGRAFDREIHRLVAFAFLSKPEPDKTNVIHKDARTLYNYFDNLKWATKSERAKQGYDIGNAYPVNKGKFGKDSSGSIQVECYEGERRILNFGSCKEAAEWLKQTGKSKASLQSILSAVAKAKKGALKTAYGFVWKKLENANQSN